MKRTKVMLSGMLAVAAVITAGTWATGSFAATANTPKVTPTTMISKSNPGVQLVDKKVSPEGISVYAVIRTDKGDASVWYTIYGNPGDRIEYSFYKKNSKGTYDYLFTGTSFVSDGYDPRSWACGEGNFKLVLNDKTNGTSATYTFYVPARAT